MIEYYKYIFNCEPTEIFYPTRFMGNTLRGGFGYVFKRLSCHSRNGDCKSCILITNCPYSIVFESLTPSDAKVMASADFIPHPFIFSIRQMKSRLEPNDTFDFQVTLVGNKSKYLPYFIFSIIYLGESGLAKAENKFLLNSVSVIETEGERVIYKKGEFILNDFGSSWRWKQTSNGDGLSLDTKRADKRYYGNNIKKLTLNFHSPIRIKRDGKVVQNTDLPFHLLFSNLLRRLYLLSSFYCPDTAKPIDTNNLFQKAKKIQIHQSTLKWNEMNRFSTRQKMNISFGGLSGSIAYEGDFTGLMGYLRAGEDINVGNGTSFGFGKYIMECE